MKSSVTQRDHNGCGVACVAFVLGKKYDDVIFFLGKERAIKIGFSCRELARTLRKFGFPYTYNFLKPRLMKKIRKDGVIVFVKRSKNYPDGHFLVCNNNQWMDPWINFRQDGEVSHAKSGFRKRLPGKPIYALFPNKI